MLRFNNVTYTYPFQDKPAVRDINLTIAPGELVLCTGASGCGKSTLIRLANGLCPHYYEGHLEGSITVNGVSTLQQNLHALARQAGTLFQDPEQQFFALGVEDELAFVHEWDGRSPEEVRRIIHQAAHDFGLESILASSIHDLSEGQKQKVGLASIMSQHPGLLILDEPSANLDPEATEDLARKLVDLKGRGLAILVVDHRLYWLNEAADRVIVLEDGRMAAQGHPALLQDDALRRAHGLRHARVADPRPTLPDCPVELSGQAPQVPEIAQTGLTVSNLHFAYPGQKLLFQGVSFQVPPGITALTGHNGAGKTTLARLLTGLNKAVTGSFWLHGREIRQGDLLANVSIVLQNADHQLHMPSVSHELESCLALAPSPTGRSAAASSPWRTLPGLVRLFALEHVAHRHPQSLSGGEKQRLVIAAAFAKNPGVLILDEPTSGLDGDNMRRIADALRHLAAQGAVVLVITHDLELMERVCARALRLDLVPAPFSEPAASTPPKRVTTSFWR